MMVDSSSDTCTSSDPFTTSYIHNQILQDAKVHKVSLIEENWIQEASELQKSAKQVRFAPSSSILCTIRHRKNFSQEEITNRWFRKEEYAALIWESSVTLTMLKCDRKKALVDDTLLCERGLLDTESLIKRQEERSCINKLVLIEMKATHNDEAVSQLYHECAITVFQRARDAAIIDEAYVKQNATGEGAEDNYGRSQHTQDDNSAEIERMILRELEKSDNHDETDQTLVKALKRLNKRKQREAEEASAQEEMILMHKLQQLADLYADPSLTPEERAAVEQAANQLVNGCNDEANKEEHAQRDSNPSGSVGCKRQKVGDMSQIPRQGQMLQDRVVQQ
ncbi:MAG: hypothetical protein SGBAC_008386 [Bacillariaceae sp.]